MFNEDNKIEKLWKWQSHNQQDKVNNDWKKKEKARKKERKKEKKERKKEKEKNLQYENAISRAGRQAGRQAEIGCPKKTL